MEGNRKNTPTEPFQMDQNQFIQSFGSVYENSSWVAEAAYTAGIKPEHNSPVELAKLMSQNVNGASEVEKLALLKSHPELAGKLAQSGQMTENSIAEQSGAGLDSCSREELATFNLLNKNYQLKFGFPFILAVRGYQRSEILKIFQRRIENDYMTEFENALEQVNKIASMRIEDLMKRSSNN